MKDITGPTGHSHLNVPPNQHTQDLLRKAQQRVLQDPRTQSYIERLAEPLPKDPEDIQAAMRAHQQVMGEYAAHLTQSLKDDASLKGVSASQIEGFVKGEVGEKEQAFVSRAREDLHTSDGLFHKAKPNPYAPFLKTLDEMMRHGDSPSVLYQYCSQSLGTSGSKGKSPSPGPVSGLYPQLKTNITPTTNLLDGGMHGSSGYANSLGGSTYPYWPSKKLTGGAALQTSPPGLSLPQGSAAQGVAMTGIPVPASGQTYTVSFTTDQDPSNLSIDIQGDHVANVSETYQSPALSLTSTKQADGTYQVTATINQSDFPGVKSHTLMQAGTFTKGSIAFSNAGSPLTVTNINLTASQGLCAEMNQFNPYASGRSWSSPSGSNNTYDFTQSMGDDWGMSLHGNDIFAPGMPAANFTHQDSQGLHLGYNLDGKHTSGGIQSSQCIPSGNDFTISMNFKFDQAGGPPYPTLAMWTYGQELDASGSKNTEFDMEMGAGNGSPPTIIRDGSFRSSSPPPNSGEVISKPLKTMPDIWDGKPHTCKMVGSYQPNGDLQVTRYIDGKVISTQDLGKGPFNPMYIKIALENPSWNPAAKGSGQSNVTISGMTVDTTPSTNYQTTKVPIDSLDFASWTPGGFQGPSYCPFPSTTPEENPNIERDQKKMG